MPEYRRNPEALSSYMDEQRNPRKGQFEIERDGETARLAYEVDNEGWISLLHTFVPPALRGRGIANELARMGLEYAKEHRLKVDVVCPIVFHFTTKHPEYKPLLGIRGYKPAHS
jgi:predicted GNAT family acetyltransferase